MNNSDAKLFGHLLSFFQFDLFCFCLSVNCDTLLDISLTIGEHIFLYLLFINFSILESLLCGNCLLCLFTVLFGVKWWSFNSLTLFDIFLFFLVYHKTIKVFGPFVLNKWSEIFILEGKPFISEEIIENAMSFHRNHRSENEIIVVISSKFITKSVIGLINLNKLFVSLLVSGIILRMIFKS